MCNITNVHGFMTDIIALVRIRGEAVFAEGYLTCRLATGHDVDVSVIDGYWDKYWAALNDVATKYDIDMEALDSDVSDLLEAL